MHTKVRRALIENVGLFCIAFAFTAVLVWIAGLMGCTSQTKVLLESRSHEAYVPQGDSTTTPTVGRIRHRDGPTACRAEGNILPWIHDMQGGRYPPRVGRETRLYGTRGTTPDSRFTHLFAWVVSTELQSPPLSTPLAPGCWLLVRPETIMFCYERPRDTSKSVDAWAIGHRAVLSITPAPGLDGHSIYVQLAMSAPGSNFAEILVSNCVELVIGSAP